MLIKFLILVLVFVGVFAVLRYAVRKIMPDGETQNIVIMVLGLIGLVLLLLELSALLNGQPGRINL